MKSEKRTHGPVWKQKHQSFLDPLKGLTECLNLGLLLGLSDPGGQQDAGLPVPLGVQVHTLQSSWKRSLFTEQTQISNI